MADLRNAKKFWVDRWLDGYLGWIRDDAGEGGEEEETQRRREQPIKKTQRHRQSFLTLAVQKLPQIDEDEERFGWKTK